ncbi:MAG: glycerate kinase type-2 family protein, partial [Rhizobiaceae bacterium]
LRSEHHIIASAAKSLEAAADVAKKSGIEAHILSDSIEGEAREAARTQAAIAREIAQRNRPFGKPALLLSGGETTVTLKGNGKGGRNTEFLLSFAIETNGESGIYALCADTDGIDGSENNAGAFVDGFTISQMHRSGVDPSAYLQNNDAWSAFDKIGALFIPGPTGTNVNDFRAILIMG